MCSDECESKININMHFYITNAIYYISALAMLERHAMLGFFSRLLGLRSAVCVASWVVMLSDSVTFPCPSLSYPAIFSLVFLCFFLHARRLLMPTWSVSPDPFEVRTTRPKYWRRRCCILAIVSLVRLSLSWMTVFLSLSLLVTPSIFLRQVISNDLKWL